MRTIFGMGNPVSPPHYVFFGCAIPQSGKNAEKREGNRHHYTFLLLNLVRHKLNTEKSKQVVQK